MSSKSYYEVSTAWAWRCVYGDDRKVPRNERMPVQGDRIYSYGTHFEMARALRDKAGALTAFLINGDTASHTTNRHQSEVRSAIGRTRLPSVIVPYSALDAAGVDYDSVQLLERTSDRTEIKEHVHYEQPPGSIMEWVPVRGQVALEVDELYAAVDAYNLEAYEEWAKYQRYCQDDHAYWRRKHFFQKCPTALTLAEWLHVMWDQGRLGERRAPHYHYSSDVTSKLVVTRHELHCWLNAWRSAEWEMTYLPDGVTEYRRETRRHWLGESLIAASVTYSIRRTCKWCSGRGWVEGPVQAEWVAPQPIYEWKRGFDTYPYSRRIDTGLITPGHWREFEHSRPGCVGCGGRGRWREDRHRRTKFLSAFDRGESRASYFFCELPPKCEAITIEDALDALKPQAVRLAEEQGRMVHRQGDIFAIRLSPNVTKRSLRKAGAAFERGGQLFGTNHVATEVAYLPNGTTLVRGCLRHVPQWRRPDHARVRLDDGWHLVQKNLVPIAA